MRHGERKTRKKRKGDRDTQRKRDKKKERRGDRETRRKKKKAWEIKSPLSERG